ncbi:sigma-54 dependent transcriptional regulator [uncultured Cohaesibacter sp.]|uniref:sigma-54-dependent transcriptional regulator n=1 Tax=uncultured Cohaesibacter sp. TaxID=1002546 RepID=UPI0029C94D35|nr:sigma-54 dependent transcriptional regulator [uncultured Cohaesibacter sp.]
MSSSETLPTVLVVDDEVRSLEALERTLFEDFDVRTAKNAAEAEAILEQEWVQIILCDQRMPEVTGVQFLTQVRERWPEVIRIIISGYTEADDIIDGLNEAGIYQYITKPWTPDQLLRVLRNASRMFNLQRQNELLAIELRMLGETAETTVEKRKARLRDRYSDEDGIIRTKDSPMNAVCQTLRQIAAYDLPVLITGESGTGKELAARSLHYNSLRWNKPFVVENCGALSDELLESELFGHKRGAFTGAVEDHIGLFERADGGTIFLDEIGEVTPSFQVKLLRVLQEGEIRPVGSNRTRKVDVRVIAATNRDMDEEVRLERFRKDLYFRMAGIVVTMPTLEERKCDIPVLADYLLKQAIRELGKTAKGFSQEAVACMTRYQWPGNVREMQNEIQRMLVMASDNAVLEANLLSPRVLQAAPEEDISEITLLSEFRGSLKERIEKLEARIVHETLVRNRWNKSRAAKELGLSRVGLRGKLERYGLEKADQSDMLETGRDKISEEA